MAMFFYTKKARSNEETEVGVHMFPCDGNIGFIQVSLPHDNQTSVTMYVEDGSKLQHLAHTRSQSGSQWK